MTRRNRHPDHETPRPVGDRGGTGPPAPPRYAIRLLGGFGLVADRVPVPLTAREQRLTALLALHGTQTRALVAGLLWPETDEHRARQNLRAAVATLQRLAPGLVAASQLALALHPDVDIDVRAFVAAGQQALRAATTGGTRPGRTATAGADLLAARELAADPDRLAALATALAGEGTLGGDLLPGWYEDWALVEAERLRHLRLHALEALAALLSANARYGLALEVALAAVALDPLRESAHRAVIEVHVSEGNLATALAQHERFRSRLARELRIAPSPQMDALVARLHRPTPDPTPGRPPWPPKHAHARVVP